MICKMAIEHKSISTSAAHDLGVQLKARRLSQNLTVVAVGQRLEIDPGQISRFECGNFKMRSKNLQKYCSYLQIKDSMNAEQPSTWGSRLKRVGMVSPRHRAAVEEIIAALEKLI